MTNQLDGVQILRAFAAGAVLLHHAIQQANGARVALAPKWFTTSGAAGVDIFFVISGFIMAYICFRQGPKVPSAPRFLIDRATRVFPLYWLCCLGILLVAAVGFLRSLRTDPADIIQSLLLVPHQGRLLGVAWTLEYEVYFYLVFAMFLPLRSPKWTISGTCLAVALVCFAARFLPEGTARSFLGEPIVLEFCGGLLLGWAHLSGARWIRVPGLVAAAAAVLITIAPIFVPHETTDGLSGIARVIWWGLPSLLIVAYALQPGAFGSLLRGTMLRLGNASYALYLSHAFLMIGYAVLLNKTGLGQFNQVPVVALLIALAFLVSVIVHEHVELPLTRAVRKLVSRRSTSPARLQAN